MSGVQGMSDAAIKTRRAGSGAGRFAARSASVLAAAAVAILPAAPSATSITVGAVPDDYRTNHPIVIAEKERDARRAGRRQRPRRNRPQRASLEGFLAGYDKSAAPVLNIVAPSGSANDVAAADAAHDFAHIARKNGVPASRIMIASYQASPEEVIGAGPGVVLRP